ncbi:MAG: hypothetical protein KC621_31670 [Myxococcales bacterium]|nr:hypothetical protein [Myxococcales bacterium]
MGVERVPDLVRDLYAIVATLERSFDGRKFTPDGHLVGSLGEVIAAHHYGLELLAASNPGHDARSRDGMLVEIKATQGKSVGLRDEPQHLLVLRLHRDGTFDEVYNGPGPPVWAASGPMQKNGQRTIGLGKLSRLMAEVDRADRLAQIATDLVRRA